LTRKSRPYKACRDFFFIQLSKTRVSHQVLLRADAQLHNVLRDRFGGLFFGSPAFCDNIEIIGVKRGISMN
jgi:hypothetical protein